MTARSVRAEQDYDMQRKQLLKGKPYISDNRLIRVLDTSDSPVQAEVYSLVKLEWVPEQIHPRDIQRAFVTADEISASTLVGYAEAINAAERRRFITAVVDTVNAKFGVSALYHRPGRAGSSLALTMEQEDAARITITLQDWNILVEGGVEPPTLGEVTVRADWFTRWALGRGLEAPETPGVTPLPALPEALFDAEYIRRVDATLTGLREKVAQARKVVSEVEQEFQDAAQAAEKEAAEAEGRKAKYIGWGHFRRQDNPEVRAECDRRLAEVGLTEEHLLGSDYRAAELTVAQLSALTGVEL